MYSLAEQWIDSSLAGMLTAAVPIWTALVATILLRRLPGRTLAVGLLVGFGGVLVLSWPSVRNADASALGVLLVILATASYGVAGNLAVPLQQRYGALPVLARAQLVALVLVLPYAVVGMPELELRGRVARCGGRPRRARHRARVRGRRDADGPCRCDARLSARVRDARCCHRARCRIP